MPPTAPPRSLLRSAPTLLAVAAGYLLLCQVGYRLAIPPNRAVGVWPPAGFALACTLALGPRGALGVWLGHWTFAFLGYYSGPMALAIGVPIGVATGAALQSLAGRWLVIRMVGYPTTLSEPRSILAFFLAGGPLACWIAPSFGTTTLILADRISMSGFLPTWWTWWLGDVLGILLAAPASLLFLGEPKVWWRARRIPLGLPLALALGGVVATFLWVRSEEDARIRRELSIRAQQLEEGLTRTLDRHQTALGILELCLSSRSGWEDAAFQHLGRGARGPGTAFQALAWVSPSGTFQSPPAGTAGAPGDLAGLPEARALMEEARAASGFRITAPFQSTRGQASREEVLMALPVTSGSGVLLGKVAIQGLWTGEEALLDRAQGLHVRWTDETLPAAPRLLVAATARRSAWIGEQLQRPVDTSLTCTWTFSSGGRTYRVDIWPTPEHLATQHSRTAWNLLALGSLFCAAMAGVLLSGSRLRDAQGD